MVNEIVQVYKAGHMTNRQYFLNYEDYKNREIELRGKEPWTRFTRNKDYIANLLGLSGNKSGINIEGLEIIFVKDKDGNVEIKLLPYISENQKLYDEAITESGKTPCVPNERFVILMEEMTDYLGHLGKRLQEGNKSTFEFYLGKDNGKNKVVMQIIDEKGEIVICEETNTPIELP